jgi:hypothetical protein
MSFMLTLIAVTVGKNVIPSHKTTSTVISSTTEAVDARPSEIQCNLFKREETLETPEGMKNLSRVSMVARSTFTEHVNVENLSPIGVGQPFFSSRKKLSISLFTLGMLQQRMDW